MAQGSSNNPISGSPGGNSPAPVSDPVGSGMDLLKQVLSVLAAVLMGPLANPSRVVKVRRKAQHLIPVFLQLGIGNAAYAPVGEDLPALLESWDIVSKLLGLLGVVASLRKQIEGTILQREAEIWKAVMLVYALAQVNAKGDAAVAELVSQMAAALAVGPKAQRHVLAAIPPTPVKGKKAKMAALAPAVLEAAKAEVAKAAPSEVISPAPAPKAPSDGSGGGSASGSGR